MKYISGLPNNPPTHLVEYFHNKVMIESVKKQLNYVVGCLLDSLQKKAANLDPVKLFMEQMYSEQFNGPITLDYLSKGIDYASFCVATKDLTNIRQGWPKLSDDFSIGMSAAFVLNNNSVLSQIPEQLIPMITNSATAFNTELSAAINFTQNGSINMYPQYQQMPQQGVQQFPANGMQNFMQQPMQMVNQQMPMGFGQQPMMQQQNPMMQQQQLMALFQQNPQLAMLYQQNPQMAMQQAQMMLMQQMQNPYMQRANTVSQMPGQMMPQAPTAGFINNNPAFGVVPQNQVGTARASSFSKGPANTQPQQVQLNTNNSMSQQPVQNNPGFAVNTNQQSFQPQPTAQQPSAHQQVIGATVVHGGNTQQVNMTQQHQPIQNANTVPPYAMDNAYSNLAADPNVQNTQVPQVTQTEPTRTQETVADSDMVYNVGGRRISRVYNRDSEIVTVTQDTDGTVIEDVIVEVAVKYEEHESQRILPTRTKAEKRASASTERMNQVLELAANEVSYKQVLEKIRKDQVEAGEELVDVDVAQVVTELGTQSVRLDTPIYTLSKTSILPLLKTILDKNQMPVDTASRSVVSDVVIGGPLAITETIANELDKLNKTQNLNEYISQLDSISRLDLPNHRWSWIHDEVLKEINDFVEKYFGLSITIDSVLMDLDDLIDYVAKNYDGDLSTQMYMNLHLMLTSTILQVFRHESWPDIVDEGQILVGKVYRVITLPIVTCQVPYNTPGKSGIVDRNTHTRLVKLLDNMMKWREDYHSLLLITVDNDIIEVNTTTIDGNYIMYCGNEE